MTLFLYSTHCPLGSALLPCNSLHMVYIAVQKFQSFLSYVFAHCSHSRDDSIGKVKSNVPYAIAIHVRTRHSNTLIT